MAVACAGRILGLPRLRREDSKASFAAVRRCQRSSPSGRPRLTLVRTASNSAGVSGRSTRAAQSAGACTGQFSIFVSHGGICAPARLARLHHGHFAAVLHRLARTALCSTYRQEVMVALDGEALEASLVER